VSTQAVAGALAMIVEQRRESKSKASARLGLFNPSVYALAAYPASQNTFIDIAEDNTDVYRTSCGTALVGFDTASGWDALNFAEFAKQLT
jgi:hypothetical protein